MEKKNVRLAQNQTSKGGLVASKKGGQDFRHGYRGRESNNGNSNGNNRPTPPKSKNSQFGQRGRGGNGYQRSNNVNNPGAFEGLDDTTGGDDDAAAELYSVFLPGSKKQNLNHLLNFQFSAPARSNNERFYGAPESFGRSSRMTPTHRAAYDKRLFLQANCQFLVQNDAETQKYSTNVAHADTLVDWEPILQVFLTTFEDLQCPICLFPPVACQITKCGHIYCWPCILHYLALSDKTWRRCPICHEAVAVQDLKSAVGKPVKFSNSSDVVTFELMKRPRESSIVTKIDSREPVENVPTSSRLVDNVFSKIFLAEQEAINEIVEREKRELQNELKNQGPECPESVFVEQALTLLDEKRQKLLLLANAAPPNDSKAEKEDEVQGASSVVDNNYFYFYQACDGQHLYLHPINNKMLETMYGHMKNAPKSIVGKILQKECKTMNENVRKRYKYLAHLPLTCELDFAEIEFTEPIIPAEIIEIFQNDLRQRASKRIHKEKAENSRSRKIDEINNKQYGYRCEPEDKVSINIDSIEQFPTCVEESDGAKGGARKKEKVGPSFAKIMGSPEQTFWPTLPSLGALEQFTPSSSSTNTNKTQNSSKMPQTTSAASSYDETTTLDLLDDFEQFKLEDRTIGGVIAEAIQKKAEKNSSNSSQKNQQQKKKGKKGVKLFTTGITFTGN